MLPDIYPTGNDPWLYVTEFYSRAWVWDKKYPTQARPIVIPKYYFIIEIWFYLVYSTWFNKKKLLVIWLPKLSNPIKETLCIHHLGQGRTKGGVGGHFGMKCLVDGDDHSGRHKARMDRNLTSHKLKRKKNIFTNYLSKFRIS